MTPPSEMQKCASRSGCAGAEKRPATNTPAPNDTTNSTLNSLPIY